MKYLLLSALLLLSTLTFGADDVSEKILEECKGIAIEKLADKAARLDAELDEATVDKLDVENKLISPSIYIWFKAEAITKSGDKIPVSAMTEKPSLPRKKPCF